MRLIKIALCACLAILGLTLPAIAAGPTVAGVEWEVRTGGSDLNGAGFYTDTSACTGGTDRSQSDSPFITFNGTSVTATSVGAGSALVLSGATVATTDKCNLLNVASGTNITAGIYVITSVNTGTNTWNFDHAITTGAGLALVGRMGGGALTIALPIANWNPADKVWLKTGTYTVTSALQPIASNNSSLNMTYVQGYSVTHGDTGTATITSATNGVNLWNINAAMRYVVFANLNMTHTAGTRGDCFRAATTLTSIAFRNDTFDGCQVEINGDGTTADIYLMVLQNNIFKNAVTNAVQARCGISANNNLFLSNTNAGIQDKGCTQGINKSVSGNAFYGNQYGYYLANSTNLETYQIIGNGFSSQTISNIRTENSAPMSLEFYNNIVYGGTTYGFDQSAGTTTLTPFVNGPNAFGSNGTARHQVSAGASDIALAACNPFVSASTGNFALSACGRTAVAGLGFPGVSAMGTGVSDLGPLQSGTGAGGGSSAYVQ